MQMAADDGGGVRGEYKTRAARRGAARVPSGQSGSNARLWDEAPPAAAAAAFMEANFSFVQSY